MESSCPFNPSPKSSQPGEPHACGGKAWPNEERLSSIINNVIDGIITIDSACLVLSFNPAAEKIFGYPAEEVLGRNIKLLMPEPFHSEHDQYVRHYLETGERKIIGIGREVVGQRKDGTTFPMDLAVSEFHMEGQRYFTGIVRDVTERKRMEEELKAADRRKDEFLAMLAHELRNPLAPLMNGLQLLRLRQTQDPVDQDICNMMERQTRQMGRLVDDLLDISRIAQGKIALKLEQIDLLKVVQIAIETSLPRLDAQRHKLVLCLPGRPVRIKADPARLEQVLANLLNNAAKYSEPEKEIWLSVVVEDGQVALQVKDQGIGIAPEVLPRIFDLYSQAERSLGRSQGGLGIGLSLVHGLVEMHGGTVDARSKGMGQGSEFTVRLPILPAGAVETPSASAGGTGVCGPALSILVVDDNEDEAQSLSQVLKIYGHETRAAYTGQAALEATRLYLPEVVLLNIGMPGMSGYEVAHQLRQDQGERRVLLVALTGYGQEEDRRQALEAGFDEHFTKPVDLDRLQLLLNQRAAHQGG